MQRLRGIAAGVCVLVLTACGNQGPDQQLTQIDAMLAKGFPMTTEQQSDVDSFIAEGKGLLAQGKQEEASAAFGQALAVLQAAADADAFNKSE